jgi:hypothetical protein
VALPTPADAPVITTTSASFIGRADSKEGVIEVHCRNVHQSLQCLTNAWAVVAGVNRSSDNCPDYGLPQNIPYTANLIISAGLSLQFNIIPERSYPLKGDYTKVIKSAAL